MPYINKHQRHHVRATREAKTVGELTFLIQDDIKTYLDEVVACTGTFRYSDLAACLGALEGAKADFIQRVLMPYEEKARERNGDVWGVR